VNRQQRRMTKRQQAQKAAAPRPQVKPPGAPVKKERTKPVQFIREVIGELKKVAWPSRQETVAYSIVVLVSTIIIAAIIFGMDFVFAKSILALFGVDV
jgi:preprotein translocase subunit SecE